MQIERQGEKLVIVIDISEGAIAAAQPSSSGKTLMVASTNGFRRHGSVSINLNCTVPNPHYEAKSRARGGVLRS